MTDQLAARFGYHGPPLADHAMTAPDSTEVCAICQHRLHQGERVARLPSGQWAHLPCVAKVT